MNLLLFSDDDRLAADRIAVCDDRLQHLLQVHRAAVGDQLRIGEVGGMMGHGTILELTVERALISVELDQPPPPKLPLSLVLALPRPKMLRRILRSAAEFGVARLYLIHSYRVEKSYWQTPVLRADTVRRYLLQGLQQSRDTVLPQLQCHQRFKPFVQDLLPSIIGTGQALLAHPGNYPGCPRQLMADTVLVIGPEGGFIPYEVEKLQDAGCQPVSLGPRILRVENALSAILGRWQ